MVIPSKIIALAFLFLLSGVALPSYAAIPPVGSGQAASYNPGSASVYHAPLSQMGLIAVTRSFRSLATTSVPSASVPSAGTASTGSVSIPAGLTRFINESSYMPQSETSIAVDPSNPQHVVGGFNDGRYFFCPNLPSADCPSGYTKSISGFTVSADGGSTVLKSNDLPGLTVTETNLTSHTSGLRFLVSWGDPWVAASPDGSFFYSSLAIDPDTGANGIMVAKSNPNLWDPNISCITALGNPSSNNCWTARFVHGNLTFQCIDGFCGTSSFDDKDVGAVDTDPASPFYGDYYIAWNHFNGDGTSSTFAFRCTPALVCSPISGAGLTPVSGSDRFAGFSTPVVGPDGRVHISWCNFGTDFTLGPVTCGIRTSIPGGTAFGDYHVVTSFMGVGTSLAGAWVVQGFATEQFRASSVLSLSADAGGPAGSLYFAIALCTSGTYYVLQELLGVAYDNPGNCGTSAVFFTRSSNSGADWSAPVKISNDGVVIQPSVTVDPDTGAVVVAYYSSEFDSFNHRLDVVASVSTDHGLTFSERRVTQTSNEPSADPSFFDYSADFGGSFIAPQYGDYLSAVALGGTVWVLFTGNYAVERGTPQSDPFLVRTSEAGPTVRFGKGPTGVSPGETVTFNATGFSPGTSFELAVDWGGTKVLLANATVSQNGGASGNFTVPNVQSQMYTAMARDGAGLTANAPFGVGQVSLTGVQAAIASVQQEVVSLGQTLSGEFVALNSSVNSVRSQVVALGNSFSMQLGSLNSSLIAAQSQITSSVADMGAKLTATLSGPSSTLAAIEYLVVVVAIVALVTLALILRRGNAKRVPIDQGQARPAAESISPF